MSDEQPLLFDDDSLPVDNSLVEAARRFEHNASRVTRDDERAARIAEDLLMGMSQRAVAARHGVSRNTLVHFMAVMEERKLIVPIKRRLSAKLGQAAELAIEGWLSAAYAGQVSASQMPVPMAIFIDKKAMLDGDATLIIEERGAPTLDAVKQYLDGLKAAQAAILEEDTHAA